MTAELRTLAQAYCDGALNATDAARLSALLRDNPAAQRSFLEITTIHARLQAEFGPGSVPPKKAEPRRPRVRTVLLGVAVAATLLLAVVLIRPATNPPVVAVLTNSVAARWHGSAAPVPGSPLAAGRFQLDSGVAEIAFGSGAVAVIEGPAEIELLNAGGAFLHAGQVVVRALAAGAGFSLETPTARVADRGTEYGVQVEAAGETILQVYSGEIVATRKAAGENPAAQMLDGGRAVRVAGSVESVPFWPERFVRVLPGKDDPTGRGTYPYNRAAFDAVHIVPRPGVIAVDAELSDWDLTGQFHAACEPPYGENHSVTAAMMYDAEHLYVAARVRDPFPMRSQISPRDRRELYGGGGGVALRFSTDRVAGWPLTAEGPPTTRRLRPTDRIDTNDKLSFLMLWFHQPTHEACLQVRYGMDFHGGLVNPPGYRGAFREDADGHGYTMEYAISWDLLHAATDPPRAGDTLAASWLVHWADESGKVWKGQLVDVTNPRETGWNFQRAATWGKAVYHPRGNLPPGTVTPIP
ncbi:MAG: hypothetical protein C0467_18705 [Planctomycetaceae bacterium]|nr:hypothetical protein [Planctomycetaceae bacterium]